MRDQPMPAKKPQKKRATVDTSPRELILDAALKLAAQSDWALVTLADIAAEAGLPMADMVGHVEDKTDILVAYGRRIDRKVLDVIGTPDESLPPRERLFEILMERFDVLNEDREAVVSFLGSLRGDPKQAVIGLPHLGRSMLWMLEAAGMDTGGFMGAARISGLSVIYLKTLRVWREDDTPDMARVMAALDKDLGRAEKLVELLPF